MSVRIRATALAAIAVAATYGASAMAAPLYSNDFDTDTTASWTVNGGPSDEAANFYYDYNTAGIPSAPHSTGGTTRGLNLQANQSGGIFSGFSVSPTGQNFSGNYKLRFDWWSNFNGPAPGGGSGSTQLSTFGVGTSGTVAQWPGGTQDSIYFGATGDGGSSVDWRAYSPTAGTGYTAPSGVFAAGTSTSPDSRNNADPYYASFGGVAPPAAQTLLYPQQTGLSNVGSTAFQWHDVVINKSATNVTWTVDGKLIATVPVADDTASTGNNIFFGHSDINAGSSSDPNDVNLLFTLIDNVRVVPEPASLSLLGLVGMGLLAVGRRRG
jgi:hypothetical protein